MRVKVINWRTDMESELENVTSIVQNLDGYLVTTESGAQFQYSASDITLKVY